MGFSRFLVKERRDMKFLLYLLLCLGAVFGFYAGGSNPYYKEALIGIGIFAIIGILYVGLIFLIDKKTSVSGKKVYLYALLIEVGIILVFCIGAIIIELIVGS